MIIAVSSAAPRWLRRTTERFDAVITSGPQENIARQIAVQSAARREAEHQANTLWQDLTLRRSRRARRRRWRDGRARRAGRRIRDVAGRLAIAPGIALVEVDVPLRQPA